MDWPLDKVNRAGFWLALVILSAIATTSYRSIAGFTDASRRVAETHLLIEQLQGLTTAVISAESAARGYVLAGKELYLDPYQTAVRQVNNAIRDLRNSTNADPRLRGLVEAITAQVAEKLAYHAKMIELRREFGFDAGNQVFLSGKGHQLMDTIQAGVGDMENAERKLLAESADHAHRHADRAIEALLAGTGLGFAILILVYLQLSREVRNRRDSERNLSRLNRLYAILTQVSQTIVRVRNRGELMREVCRIAVEEGPFVVAWIGEVEAAGGTVKPVAWSGAGSGYLEQIRVSTGEEPEGRGPTGTCIRMGRHVVCGNVESDSRLAPWKEDLLRRGCRSSAAFPILIDGRAVGAFTLYAGEPAYFDDGQIALLQEVTSDLAFALAGIAQEERRRVAEQELRDQAQIIDSVHDSIVATDLDGFVTAWNRGAERMFGYTRQEALGRHISLVYREEDRQFLERDVITSLKQNGAHDLEVRMQRKNGSIIWAHLSLSLLRDGGGVPIGMIGYSMDVTAAKTAEIALRESEERFRQMAENIEEMFWMTDGALTEMMYISPAYERIFGRTCQSLYEQPRSFLEAVHPDDHATVLERLEGALTDGNWSEEYRIVRPEGSVRWVWDRAFPIRDGTGRIFRFAGITQDITARKQAEAEIRLLNEDLERRVAERTKELERVNGELQLRREEAEKNSRMKSEFLARMSHELRTPMNAIVGFADLLSEEGEGPLNDTYRQFVTYIRAGAKHLLQLINDVLDLSRIEAGRLELSIEDFPAAEALREVVCVIAPLAQTKRIQVESEIEPGLSVRADRTRFKQILYNLVSNAVKFTPEGGRVWIRPFEQEQAICFVVSDTGRGIPEDEQTAIFDEFYQVAGGGSGEGAGLGLAITRKLVERHGGRIWVDSQEGIGSRFFFTIPAPEREQRPAARRPVPLLVLAGPEPACDAMAGWLRRQYEVLVCSGPDAAATVAEFRPDLVVASGPVPDAWRTAVQVQTESPVIIADIASGTVMRADGYLSNPVPRALLAGLLRRKLGHAQTPANILLATDSAIGLQLAHEILDAGHTPLPVRDEREALEFLSRGRGDVLLLDLDRGEWDRWELLQRLRELPSGRRPLVIALAGPAPAAPAGKIPWEEELAGQLRSALGAGVESDVEDTGR